MPSNKATAVEGDEGVLRSPGGYRPGYRPDRRSITGVGAGSSSLLSQSIPSIDVLETQSRSSTESVNSAQSLLEAEVAPPTSYFRQILSLSQSSDARIRTGDYDSIELEDQSLNQRARASAPLRLNRESMVFWRPIDTSMSFLLHQCQRLLAKTRGHEFLTGRSPRFPDVIEDVGRCMLRTKSSKAIQSGRQVDLDLSRVGELVDQRRGREYISNSIRSSRYSIWSFFPRQLVAQFSKVANFYFLIVATLQLIPNLSTTGTWTTFIPLMVFVGISMAKEGFDDVRRYRLDREENNSVSYVMNPPTTREGLSHTPWRTVKWKDIKVGDVVKLERDKPVPADIIVLHVQRTTGNIAHVETMALDGETSLKCRKPSPSVAESCKSLQAIQSTKFRFTVEDPNLDLLQFNGFVTMGECKEPLTNDHIIYRGSILRNTSYAIGLVIYTGEECKVRMNANKRPRIKAPSIQALVNKVIILVGILVSTLAITCTLAYTQWFRCQEPGFWYLRGASVALGPEFFSFFIMFNTMIPLSLYMSLEVVKLAQVFLLNDVDMYDEETDTPLQAHTSTINEELGQVKYIFSDKTGTLTKNQMEFRKLSVAGETYVNNHNIPSGAPNSVQDLVRHTQVQPNTLLSSKARMLFLGLVLCHTCVPESDGPVEEVDFQGISPDEIALLRASKTIGYTLKDRQRNALTISIRSYTSDHISPRSETYELLDVIEFSSTRKRMSVIVRLPNQQICLFCKGADNVVLGRLRDAAILKVNANGAFPFPKGKDNRSRTFWNDSIDLPNPTISSLPLQHDATTSDAAQIDDTGILQRCLSHLNQFAAEGLRTLVYAHRIVDEGTYADWKKAYTAAQLSMHDRSDKVEAMGEEIEKNLELTGVTAIEDQLQSGVPDSIRSLQKADIKIWMLTGDKKETAINVGRSCHLVSRSSTLLLLDEPGLLLSIECAISDIRNGKATNPVIVIEGPTLSVIESDTFITSRFFDLSKSADSVICCRASPMQKAFLVKMLRKYAKNDVTLAIGDGANDIAMIQEAHVGIGIAGREGLQASRMSDYSIAQFRFLAKLLLVHGRWNYIRTCKYILGTFWKEVVFYLTQALYQRWNGYTGTSLYEPWGLSMFNTLFSSLTVMSLGIFTKDLSESTLLAFPELYKKGQQNRGFNVLIYLGWTLMAFCDSVIIFSVAYFTYGNAEAALPHHDIFSFGLLTYTACVILVNTKLQILEVYNKTILAAVIFLIPTGGWFLWNIILSCVYQFKSGQGIYHVPQNFLSETGRNLSFWIALVLIVFSVILFELTVSTLRATLFPTDADCFQQYEQKYESR